MPDLPQIGPPGGLDVPGPVQIPRGNEAVAGFRQAAGELQQNIDTITQGVRRLQTQAAVSQVDSNYVSGEQDIETQTFSDPAKMSKYLGMPIDQAQKAFIGDVQGQISTLKQNLLKQNPNLSFELTPQLNARSNEGMLRLRNRFLSEYDVNQRANFQGPVMQMSVLAALKQGGVDANGEPVNDDVKRTMHDYLDSLNKAPGILPNEKIDTATRYRQMLAKMSLDQRVQSNPTSIINAAQPPAGVTPEEFTAAKNHAAEVLTFPERMANAQFAQMRGNLMDEAMRDQAAGTLTPAKAENYYRAGLSAEDLKLIHPGFTPAPVDDDSTVQGLRAWMSPTRGDPMSMTADDIRAAVKAGSLSPTTAVQMQGELSRSQKLVRTQIAASAKAMLQPLTDELFPIPTVLMGMPGDKEKRTAAIKGFEDQWDAGVKEATSVKDILNLAKSLREQYGAKPPTIKPPPMLPTDTAASYLGRLRALGFDADKISGLIKNPSAGGKVPMTTSVVPSGGG